MILKSVSWSLALSAAIFGSGALIMDVGRGWPAGARRSSPKVDFSRNLYFEICQNSDENRVCLFVKGLKIFVSMSKKTIKNNDLRHVKPVDNFSGHDVVVVS